MTAPYHSDFNAHFTFDTIFAGERQRIVRFCAQLTGDADAAEDLAQEAMIEAWRTAVRLEHQRELSAWLTGCARNVCLRWMRARGREFAHRTNISIDIAETIVPVEADLDLELARDDLATLLDRALTLLPSETRSALIHHYIEERSQAEIAELLHSTENAVSVRLHRGRLAFRKALASPELRELSASFGIAGASSSEWQETRIWCHECGNRRMIAQFPEDRSCFKIKCPDCQRYDNVYMTSITCVPRLFTDIKGIKPAYTRSSTYMTETYRRFLHDGVAHCLECGAETPLVDGPPDILPDEYRSMIGKHYHCVSCGSRSDSSLAGLVIASPEAKQFWSAHPRIRRLPDRFIEVEGSPAVVIGYESIVTSDRLEVVSARDDFRTLSINGRKPAENS